MLSNELRVTMVLLEVKGTVGYSAYNSTIDLMAVGRFVPFLMSQMTATSHEVDGFHLFRVVCVLDGLSNSEVKSRGWSSRGQQLLSGQHT
jgi:hypothetical protein